MHRFEVQIRPQHRPEPLLRLRSVREIVEDDFLDNPPSLPGALARIHARLAERPELVKLHQIHYHMNMEQFKFRTCQKNKNASSRSRTSGLRSEVFGEMAFLDHCKVAIPGGAKIVILVILDGATTLLTAQPVGSVGETESIRCFSGYLENYQLQPMLSQIELLYHLSGNAYINGLI